MKGHVKIIAAAVLLFLCAAAGNVLAADVEIPVYPALDITISPQKTGGTGGALYISNNNSEIGDEGVYKTYLSYDLTGIDTQNISDAFLEAVCLQGAVGPSERLQIYGIPEPWDQIDEASLTWENAPCNRSDSATGLTGEALFLCDLRTDAKNVPLTAGSSAMLDFIRTDTNQTLTIAIVRKALRASRYSLASTQNKTYPPPVLKIHGIPELDGFAEAWAEVQQLPEETEQNRMKKTVLGWSLEDALQAVMDGRRQQAQTQVDEIGDLLRRDIGKDSGKRLFPQMRCAVQNPYLPGLEEKAAESLRRRTVYRKSWEWGVKKFPEAKNLRSEFAERLENGTFLVCQEQGGYAGSPELLRDVLCCLEALCYYHDEGSLNEGRTEGDPNMNRFVYAAYDVALLQLITAYPDLLPPSVKERWLNTVRETAAYQLKTFGMVNTNQPHGAGYYANMDCCYTALMEAAGQLLEQEEYCASARERSERIASYMCLDGAWPYMGYANESPTYHQTNIHYLTYYYLASGNGQTLAMLRKSAPYYPLTIAKNGLIEYSTTLYFKQYWDQVEPGYLEVIAALAMDGENRYLAQCMLEAGGNKGSIFGALFYDPQIEQRELPAVQISYDRNIMGPRGRFENFSYYANGRDWKDDRGKPTLVGAMAIGNGQYPAEGFLQNAYGAVYDKADHAWHIMQENIKPASFDMEERSAPTNDYAIFEEKGVSAFGSVYYLQVPRAGGARCEVTGFGGMQEWIMFPDRVIGLVETKSLETQTAYGMEGVLQFGEGRGKSGMGLKLEMRDARTFNYGNLQIIIHEQDYGTVSAQAPDYTEISSYGPVQYLKFNDKTLYKNQIYAKGQKRYYLVEIGLRGQTPAKVSRGTEHGVDRITVSMEGEHWYLFHNTVEVSQDVILPEHMCCINEDQEILGIAGTNQEIPPYGILLAKAAVPELNFMYGEDLAIELRPEEKISLKKNGSWPGTLYLAVYQNECLRAVQTTQENELYYILPKDLSGITIKGFLFCGTGRMAPLAAAAVL